MSGTYRQAKACAFSSGITPAPGRAPGTGVFCPSPFLPTVSDFDCGRYLSETSHFVQSSFGEHGPRKEPPMERRFAARRDQLLADAEVDPRIPRGVLPRLERFLDPFVESAPAQRTGRSMPVPMSPACSPTWSTRTSSPSPTSTTRNASRCSSSSVSRPGTTALARRVGPPGGPAVGQPRRRPRLRPLGLPQEGQRFGRRAAAVVRPPGQDRQLPGGHLPRLRRPAANTPWSMSACTCPRSGPRTSSGVKRRASPRTCASARGTNWPWRCWTSAARRCRTPGSPATTKWAVARGFARNCGRGTSAICWPCRRTRRCAT